MESKTELLLKFFGGAKDRLIENSPLGISQLRGRRTDRPSIFRTPIYRNLQIRLKIL